MGTSETFLSVIAIRLAALVVAGLAIKALPEHPRQELVCKPINVSVVERQKLNMPKDIETLKDMLRHD